MTADTALIESEKLAEPIELLIRLKVKLAFDSSYAFGKIAGAAEYLEKQRTELLTRYFEE